MRIEHAVYLLAHTGIFLMGIFGAVEAVKQSRAGRRWTAVAIASLGSMMILVSGFALLMAAVALL